MDCLEAHLLISNFASLSQFHLGIDLYSLLFILNFNFCCFNLPEFIKTCFVEERRVCFAQWFDTCVPEKNACSGGVGCNVL